MRRIINKLKQVVLGRPHPVILARLDQLERDIAELRRDSLRIAELTDLVEQQLTPGCHECEKKNR